MKGFFITATNTDSGKTIITAALLRTMLSRGYDTIAAKPVQTGINYSKSGEIIAPDVEVYKAAAPEIYTQETASLVFYYGYKPACSPHLAAELEDKPIFADVIKNNLKKLSEIHEYLLVEGAGGLLVPVNDKFTMKELIAQIELPVIIVVDNCLGAINHALLTVESLVNANIRIRGIIINHTSPTTDENRYIRKDNIRTIRRFSGQEILAEVPHIPDFSVTNPNHWDQLVEYFDFIKDFS